MVEITHIFSNLMKPPDARHLGIETQEYLRQQAIHLRQQGKTFQEIAEFLGVHRTPPRTGGDCMR
jgi:hypothetical protein